MPPKNCPTISEYANQLYCLFNVGYLENCFDCGNPSIAFCCVSPFGCSRPIELRIDILCQHNSDLKSVKCGIAYVSRDKPNKSSAIMSSFWAETSHTTNGCVVCAHNIIIKISAGAQNEICLCQHFNISMFWHVKQKPISKSNFGFNAQLKWMNMLSFPFG